MNPVDCLFNQQLGKQKWNEYDSRFTRLRCTSKEEFQNIIPNANTEAHNFDTPIFACKFAQNKGYEHILALANEDGHLAIHDTLGNEQRHGNQIHHNAIFDLAWLCNQMKLITVSGDHTARLVDIYREDIRTTQIFTGHTRSVKTVVSRSDDSSTFATGSRDGCILVWDTRSHVGHNIFSTPDRTISLPHQIKNKNLTPSKRKMYSTLSGANSVTGLAFQDENTLISCSAGDGRIKFWDLRKTYKVCKREPTPKYLIEYSGNTMRNGFSNLLLDNEGIRLYANCLDNTIYCYNVAKYNPEPIMKYTGHQNSTFFVKSCLSNDGKYILCGSSDQKAYIWNTNYTNPIIRLNGHTAEVTCVAWRPTPETVLVTCSDDMRHKIWRIGSEILPDNWEYEGRGEAEPLQLVHKPIKRTFVCGSVTSNKKLKKCSICLYMFDKICENCNYQGAANTKKRILSSNIDEASSKRNSNRCLFQTLTNNEIDDTSQHKKRKRCLWDDNENACLQKLKSIRTDTEKSKDLPNESNTNEDSEYNSFNPLSNLPNFVIDGCAPHLQISPQKKPDKDWLTKIRIKKRIITKYSNLLTGDDDSINSTTKLNNKTPKSNRKRLNCSSPQSPLLKFFKITNNSNATSSQKTNFDNTRTESNV